MIERRARTVSNVVAPLVISVAIIGNAAGFVLLTTTSGMKTAALLHAVSVLAILLKGATTREAERERLESVLDAATEIAIIGTDMSGKITIFNKGAEQMLGHASADMVGDKSLDVFHDQAELAERAVQLGTQNNGVEVLTAPVGDGMPSTHEWTYLHKDGRRLTVSLAITALRRRAGKIVGFLAIAVDVTRQREQERERERLLWLERELTQQLMSQNDELVRMDRTKDEFVATVSHEFRTPLTSIRGYLEMLLEGEAGSLSDTQARFLRTIERNGERLAMLIEDLLFAARVDAGGTSVAVMIEANMMELLVEAYESGRPFADSKGIRLNCDAHGEALVAVDPARMAQLLDNLINNAIKFTPENGTVNLSAEIRDDEVVVAIQDTGIGIPEDEQSRLFRRFFRSRIATENAIAGTGIGLAIVKEIADAHGAAVDVESTEGVGTTFRIAIPLLSSLSTSGLV